MPSAGSRYLGMSCEKERPAYVGERCSSESRLSVCIEPSLSGDGRRVAPCETGWSCVGVPQIMACARTGPPSASVGARPMDACEIAVRLQPRARANEIVRERDGILVVRVTAPPLDGRANDALCRLIAKRARVGVRSVSVIRGAGARAWRSGG